MKRYCIGFLFSEDRKRVVLVRKSHPEWQNGKLNGPGGKVETGESPHEAMQSKIIYLTRVVGVGHD